MSEIKRAVVKSYDAAAHKAAVQIAGSLAVWLDDVRVATNIPPADVVSGRQCTVLFMDPSNQDDAVVIAIQGAAPSGGEILIASATVDLTLTTTPQSITGDGDSSKVRLLLPTPGDWLIEATCDFATPTDTSTALGFGEIFLDDSGSPQAGKAIKDVSAIDRVTAAQRWKVTTTTADTPVELKGSKDLPAGAAKLIATHTRITALAVTRSAGGGGGGGTHPVDLATDVTGILDEANIDADIARDSELHTKYTDAEAVTAVEAEPNLDLTKITLKPTTKPGLVLRGHTVGSGDYKATLAPASAMTANRIISLPDAAGEVALDSELHTVDDQHAPIGGYYPGVLSTGIKTTPQLPYKGDGFTITSLYCRVAVAASGADLKVKIRRNGVSMGEVNLGTTQTGSLGSLSVSVSDGDYFDIEITQTGTTPNEGSDLVWLCVP